MPRWIQKVNDDGTSRFIPADEAARRSEGVAIHGDIEAFASPIDGTVISDRKAYREHCAKHNVVPASEFSDDFYARKARERARLYNGEHTKAEELSRKQEIYQKWVDMERKHGY